MLEDIDRVPARRRVQQPINALPFNRGQTFGDFVRGQNQFADKALQVVDQRLFVSKESVHGDSVEVNGALQTAQKRLRTAGQLLKPRAEQLEHAVGNAFIGQVICSEALQFAQILPDIGE